MAATRAQPSWQPGLWTDSLVAQSASAASFRPLQRPTLTSRGSRGTPSLLSQTPAPSLPLGHRSNPLSHDRWGAPRVHRLRMGRVCLDSDRFLPGVFYAITLPSRHARVLLSWLRLHIHRPPTAVAHLPPSPRALAHIVRLPHLQPQPDPSSPHLSRL